MGILEKLTEDLIDSFLERKEEIIRQALLKKGIDPKVYERNILERRTRFNPLLIENHEGKGEFIYYNDGTKNGLFIVCFGEIEFPYYNMKNNCSELGLKQNIIEEEPDFLKINKTE